MLKACVLNKMVRTPHNMPLGCVTCESLGVVSVLVRESRLESRTHGRDQTT